VFFDQQIDINSMRGLRRQLAALVEAGVTQIVLVINSGGGQIAPTLLTYSFIRSLPVRIDTHAQGFVASAAVLLFLAGGDRSADQTARFIFHPTQTMIPGLLNEQQIHEQLAEVETVAAMITQIYHDRTSLTDQQLQQFGRSEVIYTPEQAKQDGVIQTIADLKLPAGQTAKILFLD
jgi:ATP-dependent Clp protease protease subunit